MNRYNPEPKVKPIFAYLKESIKFYELDKPVLARVIFLVELVVLFGGYLFIRPYMLELFKNLDPIAREIQAGPSADRLLSIANSPEYSLMMDSLFSVLLLFIAITSVSYFIALFFGAHYFFSLTDPEMTGGARATLFISRLPKLILFNILFNIVLYVGMFFVALILGIVAFIIPLAQFLLPLIIMILNALFVFKDLLIIEFGVGVFKNFRKTYDLTRNNKKNIIINMMWPVAIGWLLSYFAMNVNNAVLSIFISSFLEVIVLLVSQRLTVLMFLDAASLERKDKKGRVVDTNA